MSFTEKFIKSIKKGDIPDDSPKESLGLPWNKPLPSHDYFTNAFHARSECTKKGMWAIVDKQWTKGLARWIGNRTCLEIMSGAGWLSKALSSYGIDIVATDDFSWKADKKQHKDITIVHPVETLESTEAVKKYKNRDILIVSWPPLDSEAVCSACSEWGNDKPIIYIGETEGGCCAPENFWNNFKEIDDSPNIAIPNWWGIHDCLVIGRWNEIRPVHNAITHNAIKQLAVKEDVTELLG